MGFSGSSGPSQVTRNGSTVGLLASEKERHFSVSSREDATESPFELTRLDSYGKEGGTVV